LTDIRTDGPEASRDSETGRFLFVVPPMAGHMNPTITLGNELTRRGHAVAWTGHEGVIGGLVPPSATFIPVADGLPPAAAGTFLGLVSNNTSGAAGLTDILDEILLPLARQMLPGVHAAVDAFAPDVMVVDQSAYAGAAVAELRGLPWASSATTSAELTDPLAALPKVSAWFRSRLSELLLEAGLTPERAVEIDPRLSPHLILAFTTADIAGPPDDLPSHCVLLGPSLEDRADDTPFPWEWLDQPGPHVLVSLGTLCWLGGEHFFSVAAEAFAEMDAQAVFVAPPGIAPDPAPPNVLVQSRIPQLALMPHFDAVVCHGGHNTVCESLAFGNPLVIAPMRQDQPAIAKQVRRSGAGIRVPFKRVSPRGLREAINSVLTDPSYGAAAQRVQQSLASAGGPLEGADRLEGLLHRHAPAPSAS
jgi:MGT family glycosyltransferase